jgi:hypothetical protein
MPPEAYTAAGNATNFWPFITLVLVSLLGVFSAWMAKRAEKDVKLANAETELRTARRDHQLDEMDAQFDCKLGEMRSQYDGKFGEMQSRFNDEITAVKHKTENNATAITRHIEEDREKDNKTAIYIEKIDTALNILKENFHHVDVKLERIMTAMDIDKREGKREQRN